MLLLGATPPSASSTLRPIEALDAGVRSKSTGGAVSTVASPVGAIRATIPPPIGTTPSSSVGSGVDTPVTLVLPKVNGEGTLGVAVAPVGVVVVGEGTTGGARLVYASGVNVPIRSSSLRTAAIPNACPGAFNLVPSLCCPSNIEPSAVLPRIIHIGSRWSAGLSAFSLSAK